MDAISMAVSNAQAGGLRSIEPAERPVDSESAQGPDSDKTGEVSRQFEAILMRQILSESMKPLLQGGASGQVYGYLVTDTLADSMSKGGGLGLANILQAQLTK